VQPRWRDAGFGSRCGTSSSDLAQTTTETVGHSEGYFVVVAQHGTMAEVSRSRPDGTGKVIIDDLMFRYPRPGRTPLPTTHAV
jgi:hypothetical protein